MIKNNQWNTKEIRLTAEEVWLDQAEAHFVAFHIESEQQAALSELAAEGNTLSIKSNTSLSIKKSKMKGEKKQLKAKYLNRTEHELV